LHQNTTEANTLSSGYQKHKRRLCETISGYQKHKRRLCETISGYQKHKRRLCESKDILINMK